tara:strand:+ start:2299 stop:2775 length:477 start_codon:yes stop_codon:yes gene_type:complete
MKSYIYTWNPAKWKWVDFDSVLEKIQSEGRYLGNWSCGRTKKPTPGDIFVLLKLGKDDLKFEGGIIGCGLILSEPHIIRHWDNELKSEGKITLSSNVAFVSLSRRPLISRTDLVSRFPNVHWSPQQSGTSLPLHVAKEIFEELTHMSAQESSLLIFGK